MHWISCGRHDRKLRFLTRDSLRHGGVKAESRDDGKLSRPVRRGAVGNTGKLCAGRLPYFVILLRSERAAERVMESVTNFLEETLGLPVNRDKSQVARVQDVAFLGFQIFRKKIRISPQAQKRFKDRVRQLTRRNNGQSMARNIHDLSEYLRGWVGYFGIQEFRTIFGKLDGFIRSRLRSRQLKKWKKPKKFQRMMILAGYPVEEAKRTWVKMDRWPSVARRPVRFVLNLKWFRRRGLLFIDDFTSQNLKLTFAR